MYAYPINNNSNDRTIPICINNNKNNTKNNN